MEKFTPESNEGHGELIVSRESIRELTSFLESKDIDSSDHEAVLLAAEECFHNYPPTDVEAIVRAFYQVEQQAALEE